MKILLIISSITFPILMFFLQNTKRIFRMIFNLIAVLSILIFGNIAATSIYQILIDNAVFMTTIHGIFLNFYFLITGGYLVVFIIYRLMLLTWDER